MVNYFIYAKDYSGSTGLVSYYHNNGLKTLRQFKSDVQRIKRELAESGDNTESEIIYLHWGHECVEVTEETAEDEYKRQNGTGINTLPETIIKWLQEKITNDDGNNIKLLYIITDGLINAESANVCLQLNANMDYKNVVFHAIHENLDSIDLSVAASFLKSHCVIYRNQELLDDIDISQEFDYNIITVQNFGTEKENLKSYIKLKYINTSKSDARALVEIDQLKKLRDRLFVELSSGSTRGDTQLNTKDKTVFLQEFMNTDWYKNLTGTSNTDRVDIEKSISTLINYIVNEKKSYSFDALKFQTNYYNVVEEEEIVDVNFTAEQEIEFPDIILNEDRGVPVILLTELNLLNKIIFHANDNTAEISEIPPASFSKFKSTMECPLFLMNDKDVNDSIGYFYTIDVYKQLLEKTTRTEPRTRKPFQGGLVLIDTEEFDKYNDYILSATYFDTKKVNYNVGLFYYVLWKACEKKEWMDKNVVEQFKKYVMRRISTTFCKVGLSSLPLDPPMRTLLLTALWYCVELSSSIFKDDPHHFMHERMRMYYGVAHCMIEILEYFDYSLDLKSIHNRRDLIRHVMILKKIPTHKDKVYFLLEKIFKKKNGFLVSEIENPCNLHKLNYLNCNHRGMLCDDIVNEKALLNDFVHLMHYFDCKGKVKMCEKTFRPFFTIEQDKSFYTELLKTCKRVVINNDGNEKTINISYEKIESLQIDKIMSYYNLFIRYVIENEKYPTLADYIEFISLKKKHKKDLVTIFPPNIYVDAEHVYSCYEGIMRRVDVQEFIKICKKYVKRSERIKAEGVQKFGAEKDIEEFILNEESKVNLNDKKRKLNPPSTKEVGPRSKKAKRARQN